MSLRVRQVRTLIGRRQVEVGLKCLPSLIRFSAEPIRLLVHDDGTLNSEDCEKLVASLPEARIVNRSEADALIEPLLARHPKCRRYRREHPLALKLIDMALMERDELAYCDSDILFLRPYEGLFRWPDENTEAIFMQDIQDAYSLHPWHTYPLGMVRVLQKINSGLILFRTAVYDLDFIEWLLGQKRLEKVFEKRVHWVEQTCWAALGSRVGCQTLCAQQFIIATPNLAGLSNETVGIHFVAACRSKLGEFLAGSYETKTDGGAVVIRSNPARRSSPLRMLVEDLRKRI